VQPVVQQVGSDGEASGAAKVTGGRKIVTIAPGNPPVAPVIGQDARANMTS
jgi:hypothetical protein